MSEDGNISIEYAKNKFIKFNIFDKRDNNKDGEIQEQHIYVNGKEYVTYIPADATGYTIEGLEAGKTYQIEVVAVGDDENATEYAAAELSVTTKSENNGNGGDNGNTGDNGNNGNNGNAGVNNPTKDQNHNAGTTNKKQNAAAKTGDSTNMAVFVFMLGGSLAAGTVVFRRKRR